MLGGRQWLFYPSSMIGQLMRQAMAEGYKRIAG